MYSPHLRYLLSRAAARRRMLIHTHATPARPWISEAEVHRIFSETRCYYTLSDQTYSVEADGVFIRYQYSNKGSLGYVFRNPLNGENWLWVISRKTRKPFALARVS